MYPNGNVYSGGMSYPNTSGYSGGSYPNVNGYSGGAGYFNVSDYPNVQRTNSENKTTDDNIEHSDISTYNESSDSQNMDE